MNMNEKLERDRYNGNYRYAVSIDDMIERSQSLDQANQELHDELEHFGSRLQSNLIGMQDLQQIIHNGRLHEEGRRDTTVKDLEAKAIRCKELLSVKEEQEANIAPAGVINFMYSHLNDIQEELRTDIVKFVSHKSDMVRKLEEMLRVFKDSNQSAIEQQKD